MTKQADANADKPLLSIVIPVYNEREGVCAVLDSIANSKIEAAHEIVVVDDGSDDGCSRLLSEKARDGLIRLERHETNKGYGAALKSGIAAARGELVAIIDGDGTYPADRFDELVAESAGSDMVVGARVGGVLEEPMARTQVKRLIIRLLKSLADVDVPDLNSGLRLMRRDEVRRYFHLLPDGLSFTSTITLILLSEGRSIKFIPIDYFARKGSSKFNPFKDTMGLLILILRTFLYFNPLRVFLPLSIALAISALAVGLSSIALGKFMDVTTVVILLTAVQVFVLGLLADLIAKRRS